MFLVVSNGSCLAPIGRLEVLSWRLFHFVHFSEIKCAGLVTVGVVAVGVGVGVVVTVFVLQRLVQVIIYEMELGRFLADIVLVDGHANKMNLCTWRAIRFKLNLK